MTLVDQQASVAQAEDAAVKVRFGASAVETEAASAFVDGAAADNEAWRQLSLMAAPRVIDVVAVEGAQAGLIGTRQRIVADHPGYEFGAVVTVIEAVEDGASTLLAVERAL